MAFRFNQVHKLLHVSFRGLGDFVLNRFADLDRCRVIAISIETVPEVTSCVLARHNLQLYQR